MSAKCCPKPNIITYPDGSGVCQTCRTEFEAGQIKSDTTPAADVVAVLTERIQTLEDSVSQQAQRIDGLEGNVASLTQRVLELEGAEKPVE